MPTLKQCRHLSVVRMFACALLLLSPLTYFLDFGLTAGVTAATAVGGPASGSSPAGGSEVTRGTPSLAADRTAAVEERRDSALEEESRRRRLMRRVKEGTDRTAAVEERRDSALEEESRRRRLMRRVKEGTDRAKAGEAGKPSWPKVQFQQWGADMPGMRIRRLQRPDWMNNLKVLYKGQRRPQQQPKEVLCALKTKAQVQTLDGTEEPFSKLGWANLVPPRPLDRLEGSEFKSCAVVSSAASILRSSLGKEIDSHDAVLRFNAAPIKGFEADVGTKTTIRLINSQVMTRPELFFNTSPLYQNVTLVAWDPPPYSLDLNTWYQNPDYNLFGPYARRRRLQPQQPFYVLHPRFIWHLWDIVQGNTQVDIQPNPPSSGFIGIVLMMALCQEVHVYEYVPSMRQTARCHYYEKYVDTACTHGAYHPLRYEKSLVRKVNAGGRSDLMSKGRVTLPGFSTIDCGS